MTRMFKTLPFGMCLTGAVVFAADVGSSPSAPTFTLHDLLVGALNSNLELQAKRIDPQIQQFRVSAAWGAFDPSVGIGSFVSETDQPQNQRDFLATGSISRLFEENIIHYEAGLTGKLPTGGNYTFSTSVERNINTVNRSFTSLYRPEYTSKSSVSLTQPLLRDFGFRSSLAEVRLNKSALKVSQHELEITVIKLLATVTNAYFEMVFGQENLLVKRQAVELAENLVRESDRRVQEGKLAQLDVVQAKVRLSEAQEELLLAENFLAQRRNTLRALTRDKIEFDEAEWLVDGSFLTRESPELQRDHLLARMFERNPSYLAGMELARSEDIRIAYARNQRWPRVDLKASYSENGLGADWEDAYAKIRHRHGPSWSLGLVVNVPITRRVERARLGEAKSRKAQALLNIKQTEVQLLSAFDTAFRDIRSAQERMTLVHGSVGLAETALRAEERRLANGTTTSYNVGVVQRDLSTARSRELATVVDLNKAITGLYALIGTLPEEMRVDVTTE